MNEAELIKLWEEEKELQEAAIIRKSFSELKGVMNNVLIWNNIFNNNERGGDNLCLPK